MELNGQTKCIVLITVVWSTKIVNFMTPRAGVPVLGHGHISHIGKMHYIFEIFFSAPKHRSDELSIK